MSSFPLLEDLTPSSHDSRGDVWSGAGSTHCNVFGAGAKSRVGSLPYAPWPTTLAPCTSSHIHHGQACAVHLCLPPGHTHNRFTVTRVTIFPSPPQAGSLLLCSWGSQLLVSVLFPRTVCPPQEPWVIKTGTLSVPGGAHEEQSAFSSGKPTSQFAL